MDPIRLRFIYNEEEYARAAGEYQLKRGGILRTYGLYFVLIVACLLAFSWYKGYTADLWVTGLPILVTAVGFASLFYTIPRGWKQSFRADPHNRLPFTWEINEQGVNIASDETQAHFDWPFFRELLETDEFFYLVGAQNKSQLTFAPKRAFESAQQMEHLREMARRFTRLEQIS